VKVRFLADADLNESIVSGVLRREPSLDFVTAHTSGLRRMSDPEVLVLAAEQQRILIGLTQLPYQPSIVIQVQ